MSYTCTSAGAAFEAMAVFSFASAQAVILLLLVMGLTLVQFRFVERRVHYQ